MDIDERFETEREDVLGSTKEPNPYFDPFLVSDLPIAIVIIFFL